MVGAVSALLLVVAAGAMFVIGVITLSNSQEGEAVGVDERPRERFPATPNAALALTDERGRLASIVVMTLLPEGQGGSIVTMPVNSDVSGGFGDDRQPLDQEFAADDLDGLVSSVEQMLSISVQQAAIVDAAGLEEMLPDIDAARLILPDDVIDTRGGGGVIVTAGPQTLTRDEMVSVLAAIDDDAAPDASHANDVAVWESLVETAPVAVPPEPIALDTAGDPIPPETVGELVDRLWQGDLTVRDLVTTPVPASENPQSLDVVLIDRSDANLVFAQVSPGLVSTPNTGLKARVVANFSAEQLATADGLYENTSDLAVEFIGRLVFLSGNVVSVDTAPTGAPDVTIVEVSDESQMEETLAAADALLGEVEIRVADIVIEGVDVEVTLGMSYLERELERGRSGPAAPTNTTSDESIPASTEPADESESTTSTDVPGTVGEDG
jgi:hypothetical protein